MWTKMSSPPWEGRMKPWPCDLEKFLHTPLNTGPEWARTVLQAKRQNKGIYCVIHKITKITNCCVVSIPRFERSILEIFCLLCDAGSGPLDKTRKWMCEDQLTHSTNSKLFNLSSAAATVCKPAMIQHLVRLTSVATLAWFITNWSGGTFQILYKSIKSKHTHYVEKGSCQSCVIMYFIIGWYCYYWEQEEIDYNFFTHFVKCNTSYKLIISFV